MLLWLFVVGGEGVVVVAVDFASDIAIYTAGAAAVVVVVVIVVVAIVVAVRTVNIYSSLQSQRFPKDMSYLIYFTTMVHEIKLSRS